MTDINPTLEDYTALALVVLKSKPQNIEVEDYILALRDSLLPQDQGKSDFGASLNLATLWHLLFSHVQRENLHLRAQNVALESELEALNPRSWMVDSGSKRKAPPVEQEKEESPLKKMKLDLLTGLEDGEECRNLEKQHKDRALLLRVIFGFARCPRGKPPKIEVLPRMISLACETLVETMSNSQDDALAQRGEALTAPTLSEACTAARQIWSLMLHRMRSDAEQKTTEINYACTLRQISSVIQYLLGRLHHYCLDEAEARLRPVSQGQHKNSDRQHILDNSERSKLIKQNCRSIASTLTHMMATIAQLKDRQNHIFETVTSVFLNYLGSRVSLYLFSAPDDKEGDASFAPLNGLESIHLGNEMDLRLTTKIEAPYLIGILQSLLRSSYLNKTCSGVSGPNSDIIHDSLENLQRLLLHGIFPDDEQALPGKLEKIENTSVQEGLDNAKLLEQISGEEDWFLRQIWEILGWDILFGDDFVKTSLK